jgi:uroporphyrinogen decarboxylase
LFDSWAGSLTVQEYRSYVLPHSKRIFDELHDRFPRVAGIHFGVGCDHLLEAIHESGCDVVGLDWRSRISDARRRLGDDLIVQGNMDPGHIFNLGHGVKPEANPDALAAVVKHVHERTKREAS